MKTLSRSLFFVGLCTFALLASAGPACAQSVKELKYVPEIVKEVKAVPSAVNPKLPPAAQLKLTVPMVQYKVIPSGATAKPVVSSPARPAMVPALERVVAAQVSLSLPQVQKQFMTGPQALAKFMPLWRTQLLEFFSQEQLNLLERTFEETDKLLFKVDANGRWLAPNSTEWGYTNTFKVQLQKNLGTLTDAQYKALFGKFALFDDVFTRLNVQGFYLVNGRGPDPKAPGAEGELAQHVRHNVTKRDTGSDNPEVRGYIEEAAQQVAVKNAAQKAEAQSIEKAVTQTKATAPKNVQPPAPLADPVNPEDFVLTLKPVEAYYPSWRQDLFMFNDKQLDAVEQAFAQTDEWIFETDEDGMLNVHNPDEWDYEARFLTILQNSGVSFTDKQIKQLIGGSGIKGFTFAHYFTFKNTLAYVLAKGNLPRKSIMEGGKRLTMAELNKRAEAGDSQAAELAREYALGLKINSKGWLNDPVHGDMQALITNEAYLNKAVKKTPDEWLELIEAFVREHNRWPSDSIEEEKQLYNGADGAMRRNPNHPASVRMQKLKEKYGANYASPKTPDEWLELIEAFVREHNRWPSKTIEEEKQLYNGANNTMRNNPNHPASVKMMNIKKGLSAQ